MLNADSRQYRFAYEIHCSSEVPGDFPALPSEDEWLDAIFMPGDTDTFWQPPEYPPRIYLLKSDRLLIYSHPASTEGSFEIPLNSLMAVELQKSLLYGVARFHVASGSRHFRYSTVHQGLFNRFLRNLRSRWLISAELKGPMLVMRNAMRSSARCFCELEAELDPNECPRKQYYQSAIQVKERAWFFKKSRTAPALLIAVTNRRIIAISTGAGERNDPYEMALRYASINGLSAVNTLSGGIDSVILQIQLKNDVVWKFPISDAQSPSVLRLLAVLRDLISSLGENGPNPPTAA